MNVRLCTQRARGFTLIEVLTATMIFSLLIGVLYSVLFSANQLREKADFAATSTGPRDQMAMVLKRDLENMVVPAGILAAPLYAEYEEDGDGALSTIEFTTTSGTVTDSLPWGDLQKVEYFLDEPSEEESPDGKVFVRRVTRNLLQTTVDEDEEADETRFVGDVEGLEILYYDGESWVESWDSTTVENENPEGVRLRIDYVASDLAVGPMPPFEIVCPVLAQPRLSASAAVAAAPSGQGGDGGGGGGAQEPPQGPPGGGQR